MVLQQRANAKLRLEIDGLRQQTQELAKLRDENRRLAGMLANAQEAEQKVVGGQKDLPGSNAEPQTSTPGIDPSKIIKPIETPDAPFVPAATWAKGSIDTWTNALESFLWATANRDSNAFANTVMWDPKAKSWLQQRLTGSPESVRQRVRSIDGLLYDWWFNRGPTSIAAYRVTSYYANSISASAMVDLQDEYGKIGGRQILLHREQEDWHVMFPPLHNDMENYLWELGTSTNANVDH